MLYSLAMPGVKLSRRMFTGLLPAIVSSAQAPSESTIFNGIDLAGWTVREGPESAFYVSDGAIAASPSSDYPAWLATNREYENFDLALEVFFKGWSDGGIYIHAPEHGPPGTCGIKINLFHQKDETPVLNSMGALFPHVAPLRADAHRPGEWNTVRIRSDWPSLRVWINGTLVQDVKLDATPELARRLRTGSIGLLALGYPLRFRNIRIQELSSKTVWKTLYERPEDLRNWFVSESVERAPVRFEALGRVLRADGAGHLATKERFRDFELELYVRGARRHNGGVLFRSAGKGLADPRHYEIQLHDVAEAHFPTGSLYHAKRSRYPPIEDERWFLFQMGAQGPNCWVRINGETVLEYQELKDLAPGHIELQAHQPGKWLEFKRVRIREI
jgi:Domain of Unknown Function (DUF1080)